MLTSRAGPTRPHEQFTRRRAVTLMEVIVVLTILGVLALVVGVKVSASSQTGGDVTRIDKVAYELDKIAEASSSFTGATEFPRSFAEIMSTSNLGGINPGRLSHLTTKLTAAARNSCGGAYANLGNWTYPFYARFFPTAGVKLGDGFFADDTLSRHNPAGVTDKRGGGPDLVTPGTLAIVMQRVSREDALALAARFEGDRTGVPANLGAIRFGAGDPVTVFFHFNIHGC